ncbi:MAG: radical SAM/SPASM domain-containing protein [Candidatus Helarchaeota archaeon]
MAREEKLLQTLQKITNILNQDLPQLASIIGPKSIQLEITNLCNLRCIMCDRWKWDTHLQGDLTKEDLFSLFDELASLNTQHILFSGGEPLLRPDFKELVQYLNQKGIAITLITNGTLLTEDIATLLIKSDATIIFSVDGSNDAIYSQIRGREGLLTKIIENIKNVGKIKKSEKKGFISMHFVIQPFNLEDVFSFFELAKTLSVDAVSYGIIHGPHIPEKGVGFKDEHLPHLKKTISELIKLQKNKNDIQIELRPELYAIAEGQITSDALKSGLLVTELFKKDPVPCLTVIYWALIDAFGDVYPCCYAYFDNLDYESAKNLRNRLCFGNIHQSSFQEIWYGQKFNSFRNMMNPVQIENYPKVCGNCGSYFFFKEKWDRVIHFREKLKYIYENIESNLVSIRNALLNCFASPIDRAPRPYESEMAQVIRKIFDF